MPYPDRLLTDDEEVVAHLHPHALAVVRPVVCLLALAGFGSFAAAAVPAGPWQGSLRLMVLGIALVLGTVLVVRPLARRAATHYVLTTHRLLVRRGALRRNGHDIPLARISDVTYRQTLGQRLLRSGTVEVRFAGVPGEALLERVPRCEQVVGLLQDLVREEYRGGADGTAEPFLGSDGTTAIHDRW